jgi:hypothetical protein
MDISNRYLRHQPTFLLLSSFSFCEPITYGLLPGAKAVASWPAEVHLRRSAASLVSLVRSFTTESIDFVANTFPG